MREMDGLFLDNDGFIYFMADTTGGLGIGAKLCRVADGVVWFWDKQARLERGFRIDMFTENLIEADDEISKTGEVER